MGSRINEGMSKLVAHFFLFLTNQTLHVHKVDLENYPMLAHDCLAFNSMQTLGETMNFHKLPPRYTTSFAEIRS